MAHHSQYQNVLCIRADNMGDVIMASPAFRALKETFNSRITLLTSNAGAIITPYIDCIDDVISFDLPWVQHTGHGKAELLALAEELRGRDFDAAIIFTVYSQSALPAALLAYMADIPVRVAYARENPYQLLTHWVADVEPYERISHQVERDLALVANIGAFTDDDRLRLSVTDDEEGSCKQKLSAYGIASGQPYIVFHPGVSEEKRRYPANDWIVAGREFAEQYDLPILVSGSGKERELAEAIATGIGPAAVSIAGGLTLGEFIVLVENACGVVSVNTSTIHIAAAVQTPVVVLYAQTNPQHTPWRCAHRILPFSVPQHLQSRNAIIRHVSGQLYNEPVRHPGPAEIIGAVADLFPVIDSVASECGRRAYSFPSAWSSGPNAN
jgi:lipopolysaccharide heptosyltransferase II